MKAITLILFIFFILLVCRLNEINQDRILLIEANENLTNTNNDFRSEIENLQYQVKSCGQLVRNQ